MRCIGKKTMMPRLTASVTDAKKKEPEHARITANQEREEEARKQFEEERKKQLQARARTSRAKRREAERKEVERKGLDPHTFLDRCRQARQHVAVGHTIVDDDYDGHARAASTIFRAPSG
jgi:hypothetical protein